MAATVYEEDNCVAVLVIDDLESPLFNVHAV